DSRHRAAAGHHARGAHAARLDPATHPREPPQDGRGGEVTRTRDRAVAEAKALDLSSPDFLEREFEIWDLRRAELPVARTGSAPMAQGVTGGWVLTRYDDVADALRRPEDFSSQIGLYPVRAWIPQALDPPAPT